MPTRERLKILIVDDDPAIQIFMRTLLRAYGYEVETAANGVIGLNKLLASSFDLIISDINMPEMNGVAMYEKIREGRPDLTRRVLFVTSSSTDETISFFKRNNCTYLPKPFRAKDLLDRIDTVLTRSRLLSLDDGAVQFTDKYSYPGNIIPSPPSTE